MYINVILQTVPFTLLMQSHSFIFLIMYLREPLQQYQSSNNIPQSAQTLDFSLLTNCLRLNLVSRLILLNCSRRSARCRLVYLSIFLALVCSKPRAALHVVRVSRLSQIFLFMLLILDFYPTFCLDLSSYVFLNTSTPLSARFKIVSGSSPINHSYFVAVLVSFSPLQLTNLLLLMVHSPELLSISTSLLSLLIRLPFSCFLCYAK